MLNIPVHKNMLFQILKKIYSDAAIAPLLGFKGGTAAMMFYGLNRFSVDLDFDLLDKSKEAKIFEHVEKIAHKFGTVRDAEKKRFNLLFIISYEERGRNVKIEINRREFGSKYEIKTHLGVPMFVMVKEDMFANKLLAMYERIGKTSRDIYDVWFYLEHRWPINKKLVEQRAGMTFRQILQKCTKQLEKMDNRRILDGLGEFLTESQKNWARAKIRNETIFLLKARRESEGSSESFNNRNTGSRKVKVADIERII